MKQKRPVIHIPITSKDIVMEVLALAGLALMGWMIMINFADLPDKIPIHFNFKGEPDSFGSKDTLILLPMVGLVLYIVLTIVSRYPHALNYSVKITEENAERQYRLGLNLIRMMKVVVTCIFAYITWEIIRYAKGEGLGFGPWFLPLFILAVSLPIVYYFIKTREGQKAAQAKQG